MYKYKILVKMILFLVLSLSLFASDHNDAAALYYQKSYKKAAVLFEKAAKSGDKRSQYQLGYMYEKGIGVQQNSDKSAYWYKQSASQFKDLPKAIEKFNIKEGITMEYQGNPSIDRGLRQFDIQQYDMPSDPEEEKSLKSSIFNTFGLYPHEKNFFIPLSYTSMNYEKSDPVRYPEYEDYNKNIEMVFQLSLKKPITFNLLGMNEVFALAYTQEMWWQFYATSSAIRETNYRPELWVAIPAENNFSKKIGLKVIKYGLLHESNGGRKNLSREWNRAYVDFAFQHKSLFTQLRAWYAEKGTDNEDISSYLGYGHLKLSYLAGKSKFGLTWRNNLRLNKDNRGSIEGEWSYPIGHSQSSFWYLNIFNGYGASLVDYEVQQNRVGFGLTFSR